MSDLQEIIAKQGVLAFNQGYKQAIRDTFDEVLAALSNLRDTYDGHRAQEALSEAESKIEVLREEKLGRKNAENFGD
jgi:hypothetical protein